MFLSEGPGVHGLSTFKLPNGFTDENKLYNHNFSASKMFPELAGKLSLDNQKPCDLIQTDSINKTSKACPKSPAVASLSAKRPRKPTRKSLSILKKKQLGLLTDEEAKACLTDTGCKTYSHYVKARTEESELLTPLIESSDEETLTSSFFRTHNFRNSCSSLTSVSSDLNDSSE